MIVGEVFLAILFGYDGDESEVVAPHKKSQVVIVAMSEEGATRQRLVEKRRRKFADIVSALLFGYNGSKGEVVGPHEKSQLISVEISNEGTMHQRNVVGLRRKLADMLLAICLGTMETRARLSINTRRRS